MELAHPLLMSHGVVFAGGAADDDGMHAAVDHELDHFGIALLVDRMIVVERRQNGGDDTFKLHLRSPCQIRREASPVDVLFGVVAAVPGTPRVLIGQRAGNL